MIVIFKAVIGLVLVLTAAELEVLSQKEGMALKRNPDLPSKKKYTIASQIRRRRTTAIFFLIAAAYTLSTIEP